MKLRHDNMLLSSASAEDLPELEVLFSEACGYFRINDTSGICTPTDFLRGRNLPADGLAENFELLTIRLNDMLIGSIMLYRDFPSKQYVDIISLYIGEPARSSGFGTKAAKMICRYFYESSYASMRTTIPLDSTDALRFWYRLGFDRILSLSDNGSDSKMMLERHF